MKVEAQHRPEVLIVYLTQGPSVTNDSLVIIGRVIPCRVGYLKPPPPQDWSRRRVTALDGEDKWTAYRFTKNVYDTWMPAHFKNICSANCAGARGGQGAYQAGMDSDPTGERRHSGRQSGGGWTR